MVSDCLYPLAKRDSLVRWRDMLKEALGLRAEAAESYRFSYCDSFDWRLFRAGLYLQHIDSPSARRLRLVRLDGHRVIAEQVIGAAAVRFAQDLPAGEVRQRIAGLLDMRALLPFADVAVRSYGLRSENREGKTLARLFVESFSLVDAGGDTRLFEKRLRLQPLRGYAKASETVARELDKRFHLAVGEDELFAKTLAHRELRPGEYSSRLNVPLQAHMRADAAVRSILRELFKTMQLNEQGTIEDLDSEFLHDFRVAVRRTRSALGELKGVFPKATHARFKREFAWLGGLTSTLRDLDVYLLKFADLQAALPRELRAGLEPLRTFLQYKQAKEQREVLAPGLRGARYRKLKKQWRRYLESPLPKRPAARDAGRSVGDYAGQRIWRRYKRVMREGAAIDDESPPPALHELRKSCKKLRYLMEFFQSLYTDKVIKSLIKELKQLQENLGDFQDVDVQVGALERFSMEMRRRGEYSGETAESMQALLAALRQREALVRADFHARFERFAQPANRKRFKLLFKP